MRRAALGCLAAGALAAVAGSAPLAGADGGSKGDPRGDAGPAFTDIVKVKHGHTRSGRLRHVVFIADADRASLSLAQLELRARGRLYLIDARGVIRVPGRAAPARSAKARKLKVKRRGNKIIFTFGRRLIGSPTRYRWSATVGSNDTSPLDFDRAPDAGYLKHRLRRR